MLRREAFAYTPPFGAPFRAYHQRVSAGRQGMGRSSEACVQHIVFILLHMRITCVHRRWNNYLCAFFEARNAHEAMLINILHNRMHHSLELRCLRCEKGIHKKMKEVHHHDIYAHAHTWAYIPLTFIYTLTVRLFAPNLEHAYAAQESLWISRHP